MSPLRAHRLRSCLPLNLTRRGIFPRCGLADVRRYRLVKILFLLIRNANEQQSAFAHGIRALAGVYES
jgi:hypothetical protein